MAEKTEDYHAWLDPVINKLTKHLGKDFKDVRYEVSVPGNSFFISNMLFLTITNSNDENSEKKNTIRVVLKKPSMLEEMREIMRSDEQFHNEILFYNKYGKNDKDIPRCIYAEENPPTDSIIVLENVVYDRGFDVSECKYDVPLEYTLSAFRGIARFHARAYAMKTQRRDEFFDLVKNIHEPRYYPNSQVKIAINGTAIRSTQYLRKQDYDARFCDEVESQFQRAYENVVVKAIVPEEPLATLCHGDFTINNMLFKKDSGKLKAMLIDFALIRYGSPILDLSTFLCLHCAKRIDKTMLDIVLKEYHETLQQCLKENGVDGEKYSYEALYEDFKKKALFGFFIATFFLATMMGKNDKTPDEFVQTEVDKRVEELLQMGGDEISEILADMLLRLKDIGCLDHLL